MSFVTEALSAVCQSLQARSGSDIGTTTTTTGCSVRRSSKSIETLLFWKQRNNQTKRISFDEAVDETAYGNLYTTEIISSRCASSKRRQTTKNRAHAPQARHDRGVLSANQYQRKEKSMENSLLREADASSWLRNNGGLGLASCSSQSDAGPVRFTLFYNDANTGAQNTQLDVEENVRRKCQQLLLDTENGGSTTCLPSLESRSNMLKLLVLISSDNNVVRIRHPPQEGSQALSYTSATNFETVDPLHMSSGQFGFNSVSSVYQAPECNLFGCLMRPKGSRDVTYNELNLHLNLPKVRFVDKDGRPHATASYSEDCTLSESQILMEDPLSAHLRHVTEFDCDTRPSHSLSSLQIPNGSIPSNTFQRLASCKDGRTMFSNENCIVDYCLSAMCGCPSHLFRRSINEQSNLSAAKIALDLAGVQKLCPVFLPEHDINCPSSLIPILELFSYAGSQFLFVEDILSSCEKGAAAFKSAIEKWIDFYRGGVSKLQIKARRDISVIQLMKQSIDIRQIMSLVADVCSNYSTTPRKSEFLDSLLQQCIDSEIRAGLLMTNVESDSPREMKVLRHIFRQSMSPILHQIVKWMFFGLVDEPNGATSPRSASQCTSTDFLFPLSASSVSVMERVASLCRRSRHQMENIVSREVLHLEGCLPSFLRPLSLMLYRTGCLLNLLRFCDWEYYRNHCVVEIPSEVSDFAKLRRRNAAHRSGARDGMVSNPESFTPHMESECVVSPSNMPIDEHRDGTGNKESDVIDSTDNEETWVDGLNKDIRCIAMQGLFTLPGFDGPDTDISARGSSEHWVTGINESSRCPTYSRFFRDSGVCSASSLIDSPIIHENLLTKVKMDEGDDLVPIDFCLRNCLIFPIHDQCRMVERLAAMYLLCRTNFVRHVTLLRYFMLGMRGYLLDFAQQVCAWESLGHQVTPSIAAIHRSCLWASSLSENDSGVRCFSYKYIRSENGDIAVTGTDTATADDIKIPGIPLFTVVHEPPDPLRLIFDDVAMNKYNILQKFLMRHLVVADMMHGLWKASSSIQKQVRSQTCSCLRQPGGSFRFDIYHMFRHEVQVAISLLSRYFALKFHAAWRRMEKMIHVGTAQPRNNDENPFLKSIESVYAVHKSGLDELLFATFHFKDRPSVAVRTCIEKIYSAAEWICVESKEMHSKTEILNVVACANTYRKKHRLLRENMQRLENELQRAMNSNNRWNNEDHSPFVELWLIMFSCRANTRREY